MNVVTFKDSQIMNSPKFLHVSQINKLFSSPNQLKRSVSPFNTPQPHIPQKRHSSQHRQIPMDVYIPNSSELAISAKDYIDEVRKKEETELKKVEFIFQNKFRLFPSINEKRRSLVPKKSRISQIFSRKPSPYPTDNLKSIEDIIYNMNEDSLYDTVVLCDNTAEQGDMVWRYLSGREDSPETKDIYKDWVQGLTKEERGPNLYHQTIKIYGWHPRIISKQKLENDMDKLYGNGPNRRLKPGEEASILENIRLILEKCEVNPDFFQYSVHNAVRKILKKANMEDLISFPICVKQTEMHWKLMATRFRCSGKPFLQMKKFEKILSSSQSKSHFLNLSQTNNILVKYLLKHSTQRELDW